MCQEVRVLFNLVARDLQCTTAKNLKLVENLAGVDPWTAGPGKLMQLQQAKHLAQEDRVKYTQDLIDSLVK